MRLIRREWFEALLLFSAVCGVNFVVVVQVMLQVYNEIIHYYYPSLLFFNTTSLQFAPRAALILLNNNRP